MIIRTKPYVAVVTLPINDNIKFLENIKQGFKRIISWNKYRSEIMTQPKNNNLDYLLDPLFTNINRLFRLSLRNGENDRTRISFDKCYMPLVEMEYFDALVDNKPFFDQLVKNQQEAYQRLAKGNNQSYYNLIGIELSREKNRGIPQKMNFTGKLKIIVEQCFLQLKSRKKWF